MLLWLHVVWVVLGDHWVLDAVDGLMLLLGLNGHSVTDLWASVGPPREEPASHVILVLLLHGGLLVLDLLDQRLLVHQLGQGLLLVDKLEGDLGVLLARVDQLQNLVNRHLKLEWPQELTDGQVAQDLLVDLARVQAGVELEVGPLLLLEAILVGN